MDDPASDTELMQRYRDGDAGAFDALYARHKGPLYRYLARQVGASIAEELFQDVWMNVIRARGRYEARAKFSTWLYRLAHNRLIDHYRRTSAGLPISYTDEHGESLLDGVPDAPRYEPENALARRRLAQRLSDALASLPEAQREAFLLREEGGLSLEEIAAATDVHAETAKSRLRYAVDKLRAALGSAIETTHPRAREGS